MDSIEKFHKYLFRKVGLLILQRTCVRLPAADTTERTAAFSIPCHTRDSINGNTWELETSFMQDHIALNIVTLALLQRLQRFATRTTLQSFDGLIWKHWRSLVRLRLPFSIRFGVCQRTCVLVLQLVEFPFLGLLHFLLPPFLWCKLENLGRCCWAFCKHCR